MDDFLRGFCKWFCILGPVCIALLILGFGIASCSVLLENEELETENTLLKKTIEEHRKIKE